MVCLLRVLASMAVGYKKTESPKEKTLVTALFLDRNDVRRRLIVCRYCG